MSEGLAVFGPQVIEEPVGSQRVFAVVALLTGLVGMALCVAVGLLVLAMIQSQKVQPLAIVNTPIGAGVPLHIRDTGPGDEPPPPPPPPPPPDPTSVPVGPGPTVPTVSAAQGATAGRMTIVKPSGELLTGMEVRCGPGFRKRAAFVGDAAFVDGVPAQACLVSFRGGGATRQQKLIGSGTYHCTGTGPTLRCR